MSAPATPQKIKPRKPSFLFPRIVSGLIVSVALTVAAAVALIAANPALTPVCLAVFLAGAGLTVTSALVAYSKEQYELHPAHVRCRRGGLLSDQTTELDIRNITHVKIRLPWLRHKLFGIGDVLIETAGTSQPAALRHIREPQAVYQTVRDLMKSNGFELGQRELLHEESPALVGVVLDCLGVVAAAAFFVLLSLGPLIERLAEWSGDPAPDGSDGQLYILLALSTLPLFGLALVVVRFLDLRRRTYRVYDDVVVYEEGFLTRNNAFIPYENIADAETKRTLVDQIIGLYDVHISCQGSSSEIRFRRLSRGPALSAAIDDLVVRARQKSRPADPPPAPEKPGSPPALPPAGQRWPTVPPGMGWTAELRMDTARVMLPLVFLLPLFPLWALLMFRAVVLVTATSYAVRTGSVRSSFRFLNTEEREFTYDKITGLVIRRNPWDKLFGTLTLQFWSIGSGKTLELAHVKAKAVDLPALKRQVGIPGPSPTPLANPATFNPGTFLRGRLGLLATVATIAALLAAAAALTPDEQLRATATAALAVPGTIALVSFLHGWLYHRRQRLTFHAAHVEAEQGVLVRHHYFARYQNIKKTVLTRYPGGDVGKLQIFVAGEREAVRSNPGQNTQVKVRRPCSFTSDFLPAISEKQHLVDDLVSGRVPATPGAAPADPFDLVAGSPRAVGNSVAKLLLFSLLPPVLVLLPFALPFTVISVRRWRYRVESGRVVATWGILYKRQASVLLDRVDSISHSRGPLNKMFGNGTVTIMTAGSSFPDLILANTPKYTELYEEIRRRSSSALGPGSP